MRPLETKRRHLTDEELDGYRGRTLPPRELLSADAHLHDCDSCHARYGGDRSLADAFAFVRGLRAAGAEEFHPAFEQLAAYVDDELRVGERFAVAAHLEACAECDEQVRELEPLRALIDGASRLTPTPEGRTAASRGSRPPAVPESHTAAVSERNPAPAASPAVRASFFEGLRAAWRAPSYRVAAGFVGAALVVALLGWVLLRTLRTDSAARRAQAPQPVQEQAQNEQKAAASGVVAEAPRAEGEQPQTTHAEEASASPTQPAPSDETAPGSSEAVLALEDGDGRVTLDAQGRAAGLDSLSPSQQRLVTTLLTTARVETPRLPWEGGGGGDTLMGGSGGGVSFSLRGPVGKVVETARPTLRWTPLAGATSYVVTVRDSAGRTVVTSAPLTAAEWSVPDSLRRGVVYSWKVLAVRGGEEVVSPPPAAPDARFKVLEAAQAEELSRARRRHPRSHLLLGALYARAGLLDDAEREFRRLAEKNPSSPVAQKLLRDVRARRR